MWTPRREKDSSVCTNVHSSGNIQTNFEKFHEFFQTDKEEVMYSMHGEEISLAFRKFVSTEVAKSLLIYIYVQSFCTDIQRLAKL